jgi:hypothetical protein
MESLIKLRPWNGAYRQATEMRTWSGATEPVA